MIKRGYESVSVFKGADWIWNLIKCTENIISRFCDFAKDEDWILVFINPSSLSEQKILEMQMELIHMKTN